MGADFIERATPAFQKRWDRGREALGTANLFTRSPRSAIRCILADIVDNAHFEEGTSYTIEVHEGTLIGRYGTSVVLRATNVSPELLQAVIDSCGVAVGTVEAVHDLAGVVELSLC